MSDLPDILRDAIQGRVCIVGVGNRMRGDDGAGPLVVDRVAGRLAADCLDAGVAPENYLEKIAAVRPETVLLVDAADFGGRPGDIRVFNAESLGPGSLSTHAVSLGMTAAYLRARASAQTVLIGIQPASASFGDAVSDEVAEAIEKVAGVLERLYPVRGHSSE